MIYLDHSATTPIHPDVLEAMLPFLQEEYGNPSSKYYALADNAKRAVTIAREQVASLINCHHDEVVFTSGATESNNMILKGVVDYYSEKPNYSKQIITSAVEHPSVIETCAYLSSKGASVKYLAVDKFGRISTQQVEDMLYTQTPPLLISLIWGNNEVGSLNPIEEIALLCAKAKVFFHTDATQVAGKLPINLRQLPGLRFLSLSAHKLNGPKGIGAAIIRKQSEELYTKLTPLLHGGGQENEYRSGTLAVHNIVGFGKAAELAKSNLESNRKKLLELETLLTEILQTNLSGKVIFNHDTKEKLPGILSVQFKGVNNELLLKKLSKFAALSSGSACSSSKPSHVLQAMGKSLEEIRQTIRISMGPSIDPNNLNLFAQLN
ncbi:cysteine desulfurase [Paenibacillus athensensis]|uniref:Cysteine desulfurase DndA n=1 Tax=Paenibacillus athensensis TaxID=1967502 RepID=A0A4Y8PRH9_9BACL|nr:cysteine desulfurase family protein [Paenibacillus athensensis]MCD1261997.1 cysteine desulfurase [Paenibacillus athensensis]